MYYAAPEQLLDFQSKDAQKPTVDIYSFAQLAFFALTRSDPPPYAFEGNQDYLLKRISSWSSAQAAKLFFDLYSSCSTRDPQARVRDFSEISDRLSSILEKLRGVEPDKLLTQESFIHELIFSLVGLTHHSTASRAYTSRLGRTNVSLNFENIDEDDQRATLVAEIRPNTKIAIPGKNHTEVRNFLNNKLREAVQNVDAQSRIRPGTHGSFETSVNIHNVSFRTADVSRCRTILSRVVEVMERY